LPPRQAKFLAALRETCNVYLACAASKVGRSTVYHWLALPDGRFRELYDQTLEDAVDLLEEEARRRGRSTGC
jgi:hypothetical protein